MPFGMIERPVDGFAARVVDQDHGEDRGAAEDIEREKASGLRGRGRRSDEAVGTQLP